MEASAAAEPSVNERLAALLSRAEQSSAMTTTNKRNRELLKDLCFALVALAQLATRQQAELNEKPRIVLP